MTNTVGLSLVLLATYQTEFWLFTTLYVSGFGMTNALTYMTPVHHGWLWWPLRPGLVSGLIICGFGFGALIFNNVSRALVNPLNESADQDGKFSSAVNEQVPMMLRTVLVCFVIMTVVAICLISPGPPAKIRALERKTSGLAEVQEDGLDETLVTDIIVDNGELESATA